MYVVNSFGIVGVFSTEELALKAAEAAAKGAIGSVDVLFCPANTAANHRVAIVRSFSTAEHGVVLRTEYDNDFVEPEKPVHIDIAYKLLSEDPVAMDLVQDCIT